MKSIFYMVLSGTFLIYFTTDYIFGQGTGNINVDANLNIELAVKASFEGIQTPDLWFIDSLFHKVPKKSHINLSIETNSTYIELLIEPELGNLSQGAYEIRTHYVLTRNNQGRNNQSRGLGNKQVLRDVIHKNHSLRRVAWTLSVILKADPNCPAGIYKDALNISITDHMGQLYTKILNVHAELIDENRGRTLKDSLELKKR